MSMVHLTKSQIIMANLIKGQIRMVNLIKPLPFCWTFVHFDQIFDLTLGKKVTLVTCISQM
jgi:hypothetical protein